MKARALVRWGTLILALYGIVYADLVLRARSAYLEGEKFMAWYRHPEEKKAFFQAQLDKEIRRLDAERSVGRLTEGEYRQRAELERFREAESLSESSLKYAYHWYKTAAELFSPPESRWVRLSRQRMGEARELWKQELAQARIPYEDYMLE